MTISVLKTEVFSQPVYLSCSGLAIVIFMDAGSGAEKTIPEEMISFVKKSIEVPLIVGGGIREPERLKSIFEAGADIAVIGNHFEENPELIYSFTEVVNQCNL